MTFFEDPSDATGASIVNCDISDTTCSAEAYANSGCSTYVSTSGDYEIFVETNTANDIRFNITCEKDSTSYSNNVTITVSDLGDQVNWYAS